MQKSYKHLLIIFSSFLTISIYGQEKRIDYYDALAFKTLYQTLNPKGSKSNTKISINDPNVRCILSYYFGTENVLDSITKGKTATSLSKYFDSTILAAPYKGFPKCTPRKKSSSGKIILGTSTGSGTTDNSGNEIAEEGDLAGNIILGVSDFMVQRGKQEIEIAFINKIKKDLDEDAPEIKILFPYTVVLLNSFNTWEYSNILNDFKASFDKDLQSIMGDLIKLKDLDTCSSYSKTANTRIHALHEFMKRPESRYLLSAFAVGDGVIKGKKLPNILNTIADTNMLGQLPNSDVCNTIKLLNILSYSVKSNVKGVNYISKDKFEQLAQNDTLKDIYFKLMFYRVQSQNIHIGTYKTSDLITTLDNIFPYIDTLIAHSNDFESKLAGLTAAKERGEKDLSSYWSAIFESINQFLTKAQNLDAIKTGLELPTGVQTIFNYSSQTLTIAKEIAAKNYNASLVDILTLITNIATIKNTTNAITTTSPKTFVRKINNAIRKVKKITAPKKSLWASSKTKSMRKWNHLNKKLETLNTLGVTDLSLTKISYYTSANTSTPSINCIVTVQSKDSTCSNSSILTNHVMEAKLKVDTAITNSNVPTFLTDFTKYVSFASNVVSAKSPSDVQSAMQSVILPAGSYTIKSSSAWNFDLNGYIGYAVDYRDKYWHANRPFLFSPHNFYIFDNAVYAPIGLALSKGLSKKHTCAGSLTLFVGVFDIGNIASMSLENNSAKGSDTLKRQIQIADIFSPSIQIIYGGFGNLPLALCFGIRSTPQLDYTGKSNSFYQVTPSCVFNASILIDIPFFNFWNKQFHVKYYKSPTNYIPN